MNISYRLQVVTQRNTPAVLCFGSQPVRYCQNTFCYELLVNRRIQSHVGETGGVSKILPISEPME